MVVQTERSHVSGRGGRGARKLRMLAAMADLVKEGLESLVIPGSCSAPLLGNALLNLGLEHCGAGSYQAYIGQPVLHGSSQLEAGVAAVVNPGHQTLCRRPSQQAAYAGKQ
jgi:hypothetical protein